ncbi:MAG: histidine kinase, partial [Bacteroidetes bacterium]|nr:histidine kinase [Bacteroidota bacterium]
GQKIYVDSLRRNIELRFRIWDQLVSISKDSLSLFDNGLILQNTMILGSIVNESNEIRNHANTVVETYISDTDSGIKMTGILALIATLLCVSVIIFTLFKLNSEVRNGIEMQTELTRKVQELDRSNAELERFAYVASHDLHAPLRKLYAFSEILMEREKNLSPEGIDIITRMHAFVTRMQRLIDDMLEFSLNLSKVERKTINLNQLVRNAMTNLTVSIAESNARIDMETLPEEIIGFDSQLNQLFQNIISNSIKYSRTGVPPHIRIRASIVPGSEIEGVKASDEKKKFHKIVFADNGIGFDNKYKEKIFIIFQRLHGKSEYEGTGIGLATCKRVMENHNGYITASGRENEGAEFSIYFPVI